MSIIKKFLTGVLFLAAAVGLSSSALATDWDAYSVSVEGNQVTYNVTTSDTWGGYDDFYVFVATNFSYVAQTYVAQTQGFKDWSLTSGYVARFKIPNVQSPAGVTRSMSGSLNIEGIPAGNYYVFVGFDVGNYLFVHTSGGDTLYELSSGGSIPLVTDYSLQLSASGDAHINAASSSVNIAGELKAWGTNFQVNESDSIVITVNAEEGYRFNPLTVYAPWTLLNDNHTVLMARAMPSQPLFVDVPSAESESAPVGYASDWQAIAAGMVCRIGDEGIGTYFESLGSAYDSIADDKPYDITVIANCSAASISGTKHIGLFGQEYIISGNFTVADSSTLTIYNGFYPGTITVNGKNEEGVIFICGGWYASDPGSFKAANYEWMPDSNYSKDRLVNGYVIYGDPSPTGYASDAEAALAGMVCRIGPEATGTYYSTCGAALMACGASGATITLIANVNDDYDPITVFEDQRATIDANGHFIGHIPNGKGYDNFAGIAVYGYLKYVDSAEVKESVGNIITFGECWIAEGRVYRTGMGGPSARLHISGGMIEESMWNNYETAEVIVSGGDIYGTFSGEKFKFIGGRYSVDVSDHPTFFDSSSYAFNQEGEFPEGIIGEVVVSGDYVCQIVESGVKYQTVAAAVAALGASEGTIRLLDDSSLWSKVAIADGASITLDLNGYGITYDSDAEFAFEVEAGGSLSVTNSTLAIGSIYGVYGALKCDAGGSLHIYDGRIDSPGTIWGGGSVVSCGTMVIDGGEFNSQECIYVNGGSMVINGGKFTSLYSTYAIVVESGSATVNDGLFYGNIYLVYMSPGSFEINGGIYFSDPSLYLGIGMTTKTPDEVYTSQGYAYEVCESGAEPPSEDPGSSKYADDAAAAKDGKVCRIGPEVDGEYFDSLSAALACCGDSGMTITLICDYEGEVMVGSDIKATIDLNGQTLTPAGKETSSLRNLGTLVLEDRVGDGQVVGDGIFSSGNLWVRSGAVNGIVCGGGRAHISNAAINGSVTATGTGVELVISGGYIDATLSELNGGEISVTGGMFTSNPESYIATGYAVHADEKSSRYDVNPENNYACEIVGGSKYSTLSAAIGDTGGSAVTIRLLRNVGVNELVAIVEKMMPTLDLNGFNIDCLDDHSYVIDVQYGGALTITNSTVAVGAIRGYGAIHCSEGGNLVINGGEFIGNQRALFAQNGSVTVHEGRFEGNEAFCFASAAMTIGGGLFKGTINNESKSPNVTITGGYFSSDPSSYVGNGYMVTAPELAYRASGYTATVVPAFFYYVGEQYAGWKAVLADDDGLSESLSLVQETPADVLFTTLSKYDISTYAEAWAFMNTRLQATDEYNFDCVVDKDGFLKMPRNYPISQFALVNGEIVVASGKEVVVYALEDNEVPSAIDGNTYPLEPKVAGAMAPDYDYTGVNCLKSDEADPPEPPEPPKDAVAKIGGEYYTTLAAAVSAADEGDIIELVADTVENVTISGKIFSALDFCGHTLNGSMEIIDKSHIGAFSNTVAGVQVSSEGQGGISDLKGKTALSVIDACLDEIAGGYYVCTDGGALQVATVSGMNLVIRGGCFIGGTAPIYFMSCNNVEIDVKGGKFGSGMYGICWTISSTASTLLLEGGVYTADPTDGSLVEIGDGFSVIDNDDEATYAEGFHYAVGVEPPPPVVLAYTINFFDSPEEKSVLIYSTNVLINTTYGLPSDICGSFSDKVFLGWATVDKGPVVYQSEAKVFNLAPVDGSINLYAVWRNANNVIPSGSRTVLAKDVEGAALQVTIVVPDEAEFTAKGITDKARDVYLGLFTKTVTKGEKDDYTVTVELTTEGLATVQGSVDQAASQITDEFRQISANHDRKVTVTITDGVPGIYYSVQSSPTLEKPEWSDSTSERVLCGGDGTFTVVLPYKGSPDGTDQQFYKFKANLTKDGEQ